MKNPSHVTIEEWIARQQYAKGCPIALGVLWKLHFRYLAYYALHYAHKDHDLADEALGELGAKLSRKQVMRMYRPSESWTHWTRSILRNIIRDLMRKKYRPQFQLTKTNLKELVQDGVSPAATAALEDLVGESFWEESAFEAAIARRLSSTQMRENWDTIRQRGRTRQAFEQVLHENQEPGRVKTRRPGEQAAWNEFQQAFQRVLKGLPEDLRAIFLMRVCLGWSFIRIAFVLHGEQDANLVSRPFYQARNLVKTQLARLGHDGSPTEFSRTHTSA